ncbi:MAG: hypothetical protein E6J41_31145 [Chloroflexi bacterium]|nr:MAG: hypothetical protein E6J41_31145 [Chloroflexota bacterium]
MARRVLLPLIAIALLEACGCAGARAGGRAPVAAPSPQPAGAGCSLSPSGGLARRSITERSTARTYELHAPNGLAAGSRVPLLVSLHGLGAGAAIQDAATGWSSFADRQAAAGAPFVLALPDGLATLWYWGAEDSGDVRFVFDVIADVEASGCVDPARIYVDGWSEGAFMAQRMACASGDPAVDPRGAVIAAVHGYAGGDPGIALPRSCQPQKRKAPAPAILLSQGLDDTLVDPRKLGFPALAAWGTRYACRPAAAPYSRAQELGGCSAGGPVAWWPIDGFGHLEWSCPADPTWHNRGVWQFLTKRTAPTATTCS